MYYCSTAVQYHSVIIEMYFISNQNIGISLHALQSQTLITKGKDLYRRLRQESYYINLRRRERGSTCWRPRNSSRRHVITQVFYLLSYK